LRLSWLQLRRLSYARAQRHSGRASNEDPLRRAHRVPPRPDAPARARSSQTWRADLFARFPAGLARSLSALARKITGPVGRDRSSRRSVPLRRLPPDYGCSDRPRQEANLENF
jgi:hypothetical protein